MPPTPTLTWSAFRVPKDGQSEAECEDAYAADTECGLFAIADGASESAFAGAWAQMLADGHVKHGMAWSHWLADARRVWLERSRDQEMPWYVEAKFDEGAFATLLGLQFDQPRAGDGGVWRAQAVGDSCVFQMRGERVRSFPIKHAADFDSRPALIGSRRLTAAGRCRRLRARGSWRPGDVFLLATDALAQWLLQDREAGGVAWVGLQRIEDSQAFAALVAHLRRRGQLRNDDTTLMRVETALE
jgi:hypothetical protein